MTVESMLRLIAGVLVAASVLLGTYVHPYFLWFTLFVGVNLELDATGIVNRENGVTRFTEIVLRPRLTVPAGADHERVRRILEKAEKHCLVSASLSTPVRLEPDIIAGWIQAEVESVM